MFLDQPGYIYIKENKFDLKGSETDVAGIFGNKFIKHLKRVNRLTSSLS